MVHAWWKGGAVVRCVPVVRVVRIESRGGRRTRPALHASITPRVQFRVDGAHVAQPLVNITRGRYLK